MAERTAENELNQRCVECQRHCKQMSAMAVTALGVASLALILAFRPQLSGLIPPSESVKAVDETPAPIDKEKEMEILLGKRSAYGPRPKSARKPKPELSDRTGFARELGQLSKALAAGSICYNGHQARIKKVDLFVHEHTDLITYEDALLWNRIVNALDRCS